MRVSLLSLQKQQTTKHEIPTSKAGTSETRQASSRHRFAAKQQCGQTDKELWARAAREEKQQHMEKESNRECPELSRDSRMRSPPSTRSQLVLPY